DRDPAIEVPEVTRKAVGHLLECAHAWQKKLCRYATEGAAGWPARSAAMVRRADLREEGVEPLLDLGLFLGRWNAEVVLRHQAEGPVGLCVVGGAAEFVDHVLGEAV